MKTIQYIIIIISLILLNSLSSCRSCSRSGMAEIAKQRENKSKVENNTLPKPKHRTKIKNSDSIKNSSENKQINKNAPLLTLLYKKLVKGVIVIYTKDNKNTIQGSGFIITSNGICVSNYHVFKGTYKKLAKVKLYSGEFYKVEKVIEINDKFDYIIFKINGKNLSYLKIASSAPVVGEEVFAIGTPRNLEYTLSKGIISSIRSNNNQDDILQTTTEITHGSSGGPLFNYKGEVVGITTAGIGEADLNFALNIQKLKLIRYINN